MPNTNSANNLLINALSERKDAGLLRALVDVDQLTDFCSNDYLGLAKDRALAKQISDNFSTWESMQNPETPVNGSTGSRLISGNHSYIEAFEKSCARMHQAEASLLFSSGFEANLGLIASLAQKEHVIFCDKLLHASLIDGLRLAPAERRIFKHNDLKDLIHLLEQYPKETIKWVVVESIYSVLGDAAPVDDAHRALRRRAVPAVERRALVVRRLGAGDRRIAPVRHVHVVRPLLGDQVAERDAVLRLRHVVEARVVHQRRRVAHLLDERARAHRVHGVHGARLEVVREAKRVADFVCRDVLEQAAGITEPVGDHASRDSHRVHAVGNDVGQADGGGEALVPVDDVEVTRGAGIANQRIAGE